MKFLNETVLQKIHHQEFINAKPYPWLNVSGILTEEGYKILVKQAPPIGLFTKNFGMQRGYGQKSHDRYTLTYKLGVSLPSVWQEFIDELLGKEYQEFITRVFGKEKFNLQFEWHYSTRGCSVSPHCDGERKIGTHIFYLNTQEDWKEEYGGQTLVLIDTKNQSEYSSPNFSDFKEIIIPKAMGNWSFLFEKTKNSWHGVRELTSPPEAVRKIFSVTINSIPSFQKKVITKIRTLLRRVRGGMN
ncbi:MAG: 2OG-Fe(II) oxygenase [Patescibacteria group bacterium]